MNSRYYEDKKRGMINEIKFKAYMEHTLNRPIKKYKDQYAELDFRDGRNLLELKGRGITHNQFPTTIFGYNKLLKARRKSNQGYHIYFINIKDLEFITNKFVSINNEERGSYRS